MSTEIIISVIGVIALFANTIFATHYKKWYEEKQKKKAVEKYNLISDDNGNISYLKDGKRVEIGDKFVTFRNQYRLYNLTTYLLVVIWFYLFILILLVVGNIFEIEIKISEMTTMLIFAVLIGLNTLWILYPLRKISKKEMEKMIWHN